MNPDNEQYTIYTIGHGNRKTDDFIYLLKKYEIELLVDVRTYPYSRFHTQFRQVALESSLDVANINYLFLGDELGGRPKDPALYINNRVNYAAVKQTALFRLGIEQVEKLTKQGIRLALMCSEADQNHCHRKHMLTGEFVQDGFMVIHINKSGSLEDEAKDETLGLF
jgi:uncharacterized protein (DUF488 family)